MSDRGRSPQEIERAISRRQEELSEDLREFEYRLSRRGVKDQAREQAAGAVHTVVDRATALKDKAAGRVSQVGSQASRQLGSLSIRLSQDAHRNRFTIALAAGALAVALGIMFARRAVDEREEESRAVPIE
jgi:CHASE3 domain sensor protein